VPQADYLAPEGYEVAYRTNATTRDGEHGNALLSRWPIGDIGHHDVSDHRFEQRGLLHVPVEWNGTRVHAIVAHFGLIHASRVRQVQRLGAFVEQNVPRGEPVIVAGDFNDWGDKLDEMMTACRLTRACGPGDPPSRVNTFPRASPCSRWTGSTSGDSAASRPQCRAVRPGRGCLTTCRWSRSSPSRRAVAAMGGLVAATSEPSASPALRPGHAIDLLKGGEALFAALVQAIDAARAEVLLESYIFEFAGAPLQVAEALERAATRSVRVRVVVDGIGTGDVPAEWQARWKAAGVQWRVYNPARGWRVLMPRRWRRLHRKLAVVDGRVVFCGGINLLDDYRDPTHGKLDEPRFDFAVRVTGPLVADAHETMTRLWLRLQATREARHFDFAMALATVRAASRAGTDMHDPHIAAKDLDASAARGRARRGRPAGRAGAARQPALSQADRALLPLRHRPGAARDHHRQRLLRSRRGAAAGAAQGGRARRQGDAAAAGQVRVLHAAPHQPGDVRVLLAAGIEIIEYEPSFLHAKVAVFDGPQGAIATVGSSNLDPISLLLAREANVFVRDDAFAAELRSHLLEAVQTTGARIDSSAHMKRPFTVRSLAWLAYGLMRVALFATRHRY
jgi:cardiolipin synthase